MELKAFISYSWDNDEHTEWTNRIAHILRTNGIHSLIDQISVQPGNNLEKFMLDGIGSSKWVLCVVSSGYINKMNDITTGVGKEIETIKEKMSSEFVIPLLKNNPEHIVPDILKGKFYINFDVNDETKELQKLVKRISGIDRELEPIVVENPFSKEAANERILDAEIAKSTYINPAPNGIVDFNYSNNDGVFTIGSGKFGFSTEWSKASNVTIHAYKDRLNGGKIAYIKNLNSLTAFCSSENLDFTSRVRSVSVGDAVVWINSFGNMAVTRITKIMDDTRNDPCDNLTFEYEILDKPK
jgi:hypothetical protein